MFNLRNLDTCEFVFDDPIVPYTLKDYVEVRDAYVERISRIPDVKSIYQMGGISTPGISDLDLIVVLNDELKYSQASNYSIKTLGKKGVYFFMHDPIFVNEIIFKNFNLLYYTTNLKKLFGEDLPQVQFSSENDYIKLAILIDYGLQLLHKLTKPLVCKFIYVRSILPILYSIKYSIKLAADLNIKTPNFWTKFINEVTMMRGEWLFRRDYDKLVHLIIEGLSVVLDILVQVDKLLLEENVIKLMPSFREVIKYTFNSYDSTTIFTRDPKRLYSLESADHIGIKHIDLKARGKRVIVFLTIAAVPLSFYYHFLSYTKGSGRYSNYLKKLLGDNTENNFFIDPSYQTAMTKRIDLYDSYRRFTKENKLPCEKIVFFEGQNIYPTINTGLLDVIQNGHLYLILLLNKFTFAIRLKRLEKLLIT